MTDLLPDPTDPTRQHAVGRSHPETSREATAANTVKFANERGVALAFVFNAGDRGATVAECADANPFVYPSRNQCSISFIALRDLGYIERVDKNTPRLRQVDEVEKKDGYIARPTGPRSMGVVHVMTPIGRMEYARREAQRPK